MTPSCSATTALSRVFPPSLPGRNNQRSGNRLHFSPRKVIGLRPQEHLWGGATRKSRWVNFLLNLPISHLPLLSLRIFFYTFLYLSFKIISLIVAHIFTLYKAKLSHLRSTYVFVRELCVGDSWLKTGADWDFKSNKYLLITYCCTKWNFWHSHGRLWIKTVIDCDIMANC